MILHKLHTHEGEEGLEGKEEEREGEGGRGREREGEGV